MLPHVFNSYYYRLAYRPTFFIATFISGFMLDDKPEIHM
jgi:hypothetical protein